MAGRLNKKQRALLAFLKARIGTTITDAEILKATGWKAASWKVYVNKGYYGSFMQSLKPGKYRVCIDPNTTEGEFHAAVTQTKKKTRFRAPLATALLGRSRDNMVLALEVYNRPSLANRLDAFAMLFTTGWEQLMKAELVEAHGENSIFRPKKAGQRRESIGLADCLERMFPDQNDPTRRNIERIAELRHAATHLVMPEVQPVYARLFQAGVLGYARRLLEKTGEPLVPRNNIGLLALAASEGGLDVIPLSRLYGDAVAKDIIEKAKTIEQEVQSVNDHRFAVPMNYTIRFASGGEQPDVSLVHAAEAPTGAVVFEKPVDPEKTHPLRTMDVVSEVAARVDVPFNAHDLQAVLFKTKWKKADNEFHRLQRNPDTPKFSAKAVDAIVKLIEDDASYLKRARTSYSSAQAKARKKAKKG